MCLNLHFREKRDSESYANVRVRVFEFGAGAAKEGRIAACTAVWLKPVCMYYPLREHAEKTEIGFCHTAIISVLIPALQIWIEI